MLLFAYNSGSIPWILWMVSSAQEQVGLIALAFILLCGYGAARATANAKTLNFTSNFAAFVIFYYFWPN